MSAPMSRLPLAVAALFAGLAAAVAAPLKTGEEIALWPSAAPGSAGVTLTETITERSKDPAVLDRAYTGITRPTLTAFVPAEPNGAAVIVAPGGAYMRVVFDKEGADVAKAFGARGVTVFVLKYRLPGEGHDRAADVPLEDAQRAVRLVRANAADWKIDPNRIGFAGFSAGGHLSATLATRFGAPVYAPVDAADRLSARPDFSILVYPVISMETGLTHADSRKMLLGPAPDAAAIAKASADLAVTAETPPTFLAVAHDDSGVDPANTIRYYLALKAAKVPAELHVFPTSDHGFGIRFAKGAARQWPELALNWIAAVTAPAPAK
jgi:acetyl esterase/lipase